MLKKGKIKENKKKINSNNFYNNNLSNYKTNEKNNKRYSYINNHEYNSKINKNEILKGGKNDKFEYCQKHSVKEVNPEQLITDYISLQKKNSDQYQSVFEEDILKETLSYKNKVNNFSFKGEIDNLPIDFNIYYFEELLLEYYIKIISGFFPNLSSTEIMEKICEFDFDIDNLVISLLDINHETNPGELNKFANSQISEDSCLDIFKNIYFEDIADYECIKEHNLQLQIEHEIKKNPIKNSNQIIINNKEVHLIDLNSNNQKNYIKNNEDGIFTGFFNLYEYFLNFFKKLIKIQINIINFIFLEEEYFLDKQISEIKNKTIREDLKKLILAFPSADETDIKWVYYQYMDYKTCFNYFLEKGGDMSLTKISNNKLSQLIKNNENSLKINEYKTAQNKNTKIKSSETHICLANQKRFLSTPSGSSKENSITNNFYKIINEIPQNWQFENNGQFNLSDYQELRKKLLNQAQLAWRSGRHQDAIVNYFCNKSIL